MTAKRPHDGKPGVPQVRSGPIPWLNDSLRVSIEESVIEYCGHSWKITRESDYSEFSCHHSAIVSDGSLAVFFKYSDTTDAKRRFEVELSNLRTLVDKAGVLVPKPIGIVQVDKGMLLLMEALEAINRGPGQWKQIGATLARIHRVKGETFGFNADGFWGPLFQDNKPTLNWANFYKERRLLPLLKTAADSGNVPLPVLARIESLIPRLPELCGPEVTPTLLHGDAQQNNFISTAGGTYIIDPAIYFGHPEMDLAFIDSFQPVPDTVFKSYRDEMPIDSGFGKRRDLWRIPLYLAAVALEGPMHLPRLTNALKTYF